MSDPMVDASERDSVLNELKRNPINNRCIDCNRKNPTWASCYFGIFICYDCSSKHRSYTPAYSFVRSVDLDQWTHRQLLCMSNGGNDKALEYFKKNGLISDTNKNIDYKQPAAQRYKNDLIKKAELIIAKTHAVPAPKQEKPLNVDSNPAQNQLNSIVEQFNKNSNTESSNNSSQQEKADDQASQVTNNNIDNLDKVVEKKVVFNSKKDKVGKKGVKAQKVDDFDFDSLVIGNANNSQQEQEQQTKQTSQSASSAAYDFKLYEETQEYQDNKKKQTSYTADEDDKGVTPQQQQEKLNQLKTNNKNVKSISSDYFNQQKSVQEDQNFQKFAGAKSISSRAFYGEQELPDDDDDDDKFEGVRNFIFKAKDNIDNITQKAKDYFNNWK